MSGWCGEAAQQGLFRAVAGEGESAQFGCLGQLAAAELDQQVAADGVVEVIAVQAGGERVDLAQRAFGPARYRSATARLSRTTGEGVWPSVSSGAPSAPNRTVVAVGGAASCRPMILDWFSANQAPTRSY